MHRASNTSIASMWVRLSFDPEEVAASIQKRLPGFKLEYDVNPLLQSIADSWPDDLDDTAAREEWDWAPKYNLDQMTNVMLDAITKRVTESA